MAKKAVAAAKKAAAAAKKEAAARRKAETEAAKKAKQDAALIAKAVDQEVNAAKRKAKKRKRVDIFHAQCDSCDQWVEVETLPTTEQWYCDTCPEP
jgi:formamidopyrimidine-DNA glycosylase